MKKQRRWNTSITATGFVPRQQRFGHIHRSLMKALDVPVQNTYGLRPAAVQGTKDIAPLTAFRDLDKLGLLKNVPTVNFHPHLPHVRADPTRTAEGGAGACAPADRS